MGLRDYIIKRIIIVIPTIVALSLITFTIMHLAPGGPLDYYLAENPLLGRDPLRVETLKERMGLNKPIWEQYLIWVRNILSGNLGWSFHSGEDVTKMILGKLNKTATLMLTSLVISLLIAIPLGVTSAVRQYSKIDNLMMFFSLFGTSMPGFWFALMLIFTFALGFGWVPTSGTHTLGMSYPTVFHELLDRSRYLILPVVTLSLGRLAQLSRLTRSSMLDVLKQDYITTARAKGLSETIVIYKHALRNALLPVITVVGLNIGFLFAGSATVETIFAWPGLGKFMVDNIYKRDYPAIMGSTMLIAVTVITANLITDIVYAYLDPRIRY
jgi:peptide/nickel transport system permease protein